jgi:hypothetical protein
MSLFSSKTYVAMPTSLTEEDLSRLESLCMLFEVGLALFDVDKNNPRFFDSDTRATVFSGYVLCQ